MRRWLPAMIIAAAFLVSLIAYPRLPETMPTHWGVDGEPDGWSGKLFGAFGLPTIATLLWLLLTRIPGIDPRAANIAKFRASYDVMIVAALLLFLAIHAATIAIALGWPIPIARLAPVGVGAFFIVLGNLLPRARSNFMFGIRTPWTLSDDEVWARSHRVGGYLLVAAGIVIMSAALVRPPWSVGLLIGSITLASLGSLVYSYVIWARRQRGS